MKRIFRFYIEGFKRSWMSKVGKYLWMILLLKLFIMFIVLKIFFFPDLLKKNFKSDKDRSSHVLEVLTGSK